MTINHIDVNLPTGKSYPIFIQRDNLEAVGSLISNQIPSKRFIIISHEQIFNLYGHTIVKQLDHAKVDHFFVPEGESSKSMACLQTLLSQILESKVERHDCIIALGGGVIGDLAGFVASICLRGIHLVHVPTTLLAQVDSSIGGKTGINHPTGKNLIGSFYQPQLIVMDPNVLVSLSKDEIRSGFAEVIKYGVICDTDLFMFLEQHSDDLRNYDMTQYHEKWDYIIQRSAQNKVDVVAKDEKEANLRAILNFGHTIGHGLEAIFGNYDFKHGECVAFGMIAATYIATQKHHIESSEANRIYDLIEAYKFKMDIPTINLASLHEKLSLDKKISNGKIRFILPTKIGNVLQDNTVSTTLIDESISFLADKMR